jgi:hypothetical protein
LLIQRRRWTNPTVHPNLAPQPSHGWRVLYRSSRQPTNLIYFCGSSNNTNKNNSLRKYMSTCCHLGRGSIIGVLVHCQGHICFVVRYKFPWVLGNCRSHTSYPQQSPQLQTNWSIVSTHFYLWSNVVSQKPLALVLSTETNNRGTKRR